MPHAAQPAQNASVAYWLKVTGTSESPFLDGDWAARRRGWIGEYGHVSMFPRWPSVRDGDLLIDYAAGSYRRFGEARIYAVEEVVSDPTVGPHERWKVLVETRMLAAGPRLEHCPTIADIGVMRRSVSQHSHIRLTQEQGRHARDLIQRAATQHGSLALSD
jgi:hypothetical protein